VKRTVKKLLVLVVLGLVGASCTGDYSIEFNDVYIIEPSGPNAAIYMDIDNPTDVDYRLVGVTVEGYMTQIHNTQIAADGQAMMQPMEGIDVPTGEVVQLRPGGMHVMIMSADGITAGDEIELSFSFEASGGGYVEQASVVTIGDYLAMIEAE